MGGSEAAWQIIAATGSNTIRWVDLDGADVLDLESIDPVSMPPNALGGADPADDEYHYAKELAAKLPPIKNGSRATPVERDAEKSESSASNASDGSGEKAR
jgi:hypothetical protein